MGHRPNIVLAKNTIQFFAQPEEFLDILKRSGASYVQVDSFHKVLPM